MHTHRSPASASTFVLLGIASLALFLAAGGCEAGARPASCTTCDGRVFRDSDCARFAAVAGCASSMVETPSAGCSGRCVFTECTGIPICTGLTPDDGGPPDTGPSDGGSTSDAPAVDAPAP